MTKDDRGVAVEYGDGAVVQSQRVLIDTGIGPERDALGSNIAVLNPVRGARVLKDEMTTGLVSLGKTSDWFKGKRIGIYGGGALAAWVAESLD